MADRVKLSQQFTESFWRLWPTLAVSGVRTVGQAPRPRALAGRATAPPRHARVGPTGPTVRRSWGQRRSAVAAADSLTQSRSLTVVTVDRDTVTVIV
jgi:hypothetical protein